MVSTKWIHILILCVVGVCIAAEQPMLDYAPQVSSVALGSSVQTAIPEESKTEIEYVHPPSPAESTARTATVTIYSTSLPYPPDRVGEKEITPLIQQLLAPVVFVYNIIRSIVSRIFRVIAFFISPFVKTASLLLTMLVFRPLILMQYLLTALYPVFFFLTIAMVTGICFGAVGGWFSEVILGILSKSAKPQAKSPEPNHKFNLDKFRMQYPMDSEAEDEWFEDEI
ncbi:hypothetical protein K493DRAFT_311894 [Basidiobolus meristosporus CBS 931.73]|uniref:Uncharacterized protein n=1 Tax=Basidiobolus meristosporus CBS 931.73 TaxID=1314790 RepID=A0A1Y1YZM8_9FUNG|nr:hypothetical protein K493DRAFT_311894 [Basidiobolus meristosporus CBS 931.73]|eukprot:ORY03005.1 hypothetical protein K493DRAFT_311894 [Basidiobolus meristosporus CBS 931.73]